MNRIKHTATGHGEWLSVFAVLAAASTTWPAAQPARAGIIIDSFEDANAANWPITLSEPSSASPVDANVRGVIGGWRETYFGSSAFEVPGIDQVFLDILPAEGVLSYASVLSQK